MKRPVRNVIFDFGGVLDAVGVQRAALVGHSWGSLIALEAAARLKDRVSHLVLVGAASHVGSRLDREVAEWTAAPAALLRPRP